MLLNISLVNYGLPSNGCLLQYPLSCHLGSSPEVLCGRVCRGCTNHTEMKKHAPSQKIAQNWQTLPEISSRKKHHNRHPPGKKENTIVTVSMVFLPRKTRLATNRKGKRWLWWHPVIKKKGENVACALGNYHH